MYHFVLFLIEFIIFQLDHFVWISITEIEDWTIISHRSKSSTGPSYKFVNQVKTIFFECSWFLNLNECNILYKYFWYYTINHSLFFRRRRHFSNKSKLFMARPGLLSFVHTCKHGMENSRSRFLYKKCCNHIWTIIIYCDRDYAFSSIIKIKYEKT